MLTGVGQESEIVVSGAAGTCALTMLVVGGGGHDGSGGGGAGSGHLEYRSFQVTLGTMLTARVGDQREASSLAIRGGDTVTAQPGQDGQDSFTGGDGYCGGGGAYGGGGGSGGSDGQDGSFGRGGAGTGEDVSLYTFTTWTLTPGAGGQPGQVHGQGGGGGGLLVDGAGPQASKYQGQGYGGGANGYYTDPDGLPGLILIEVN